MSVLNFFFSSRRRHTRFKCDWSSDVCSSDLKTSEFTPQCGALIEKLFIDAGFPKDLVKIVQGGGEVGQALIDAWPDKVMFTGSVATGRRVAEACAKKLLPSVLELAGKDPMIFLLDADLQAASTPPVCGTSHT